jgi:hypothetical protein
MGEPVNNSNRGWKPLPHKNTQKAMRAAQDEVLRQSF